ncbi:uncharacterized protein LOC107002007 [Solanum pennellii]|uniref:Uncharacterized protein LOC107002007 n=1 Tax=Solanum pennellii TaxID=28526 RepID=A0ABM1FDP6_SOLPN|nr:uncharacterized protein LOC107002007 [Solanum pennellii]
MSQSVEEQSSGSVSGRRCAICFATRPFILHLLFYRGLQQHLCTSCVLDSHPGSFCPTCFDVFLHNSPPPHLLALCKKCPSISHLSCVPDVAFASNDYLCPPCSNPNFTFFCVTPNRANNAIEINLHLAKQLVAAATIATESIHNAAAMARYNAEIRVKEALVAKAEAAEVLKRFNNLLNNHGHRFGNDAGGSKIHEEEGCSSRFPNADDDTFVD